MYICHILFHISAVTSMIFCALASSWRLRARASKRGGRVKREKEGRREDGREGRREREREGEREGGRD